MALANDQWFLFKNMKIKLLNNQIFVLKKSLETSITTQLTKDTQ